MSRARHRTPLAEDGWTTLDAVLEGTWTTLVRGAATAKSAFHAPALATVSPDGAPDVRTVILRVCEPEPRTLVCHTDRRSPKLDHLTAEPRVGWLFYDASRKVQVRATAIATVHAEDALADARWEASSLSSRRCYLAPFIPGGETPADHDGPHPNLPTDISDRLPTDAETAPGRAQFAVIRTQITSLDWLYLRYDGHRRARFTWDNDGALTAAWVMP